MKRQSFPFSLLRIFEQILKTRRIVAGAYGWAVNENGTQVVHRPYSGEVPPATFLAVANR